MWLGFWFWLWRGIVLLLIGEENKHHGVLEVLRETIEAFPGIFDDTADMMRHGKARYAVEKGDDGLKYRILDLDVAPPPVLQEHWELPKRKQRGLSTAAGCGNVTPTAMWSSMTNGTPWTRMGS